jgi:hemerythrin-like domain-containing protein
MNTNDTTRCLREEHQVILKVLDCFEIALRNARAAGAVTQAEFDPFVEFFRDFADRCHHCKEEDRLFPCLERCGMERDHGPIAVMLHEHQIGRAHVRAIAAALPAADAGAAGGAAGDRAAYERVISEGEGFLSLLRHHIMKEDHVLFEMADQMIQAAEQAQLSGAYAEADDEAANRDALARCRRLADDLCARYGVSPPAPEHAQA